MVSSDESPIGINQPDRMNVRRTRKPRRTQEAQYKQQHNNPTRTIHKPSQPDSNRISQIPNQSK
ncbi:hypothetical protein M422DRAFT_30001 [Sphaerobolus stellatus SS14]|uniref:Unplaced genomic scaffold SPHSTscaffold_38, whole genome shotgun sequence n=1 Tax=Sphaerobolus stellatus (strain SS14) TaxID=990650 RepID=A0A0C9W2C0_SPHS4|nr:hypothetical protein M422DRAFT_30001 [Sphaerobolus stellatus SS14]